MSEQQLDDKKEIMRLKEENETLKYQLAFKQWKLKELKCPNCGSTELSPPNQYCTKRYSCRKCYLEFDPVKPRAKEEIKKIMKKR